MQGINGTIIAYGQTGSGKTHTIVNEILPSCAKYCWEQVKKTNGELNISCFQIYNEKIQDLITQKKNLQLRQVSGNFEVKGLHIERISDLSQLEDLIKISESNRNVGCTSMNNQSSRSHAVYSFIVVQKEKNLRSELNLVDLSGSERFRKSMITDGHQQTESISINKSLTTLTKCIYFLSEDNLSHIPFRESKLTKILKNSLGGNSKTSLIINVSSRKEDIDETVSSLCFGQRACKIEVQPRVNKNKNINYKLECQ